MRFGQSPGSTDMQDAPAQYISMDAGNSIEHELRPVKLNLRRNRPLVSLGYMSAGLPELTALEHTWAPTFIRAGCSAFVGSLWAVQQSVEAAFISSFYRRLWAGDSLGGALKAGRRLAQMAAPESPDWLAYVLFGDPMARPYRPTKGPYKYRFFGQLISERVCVPAPGVSASVAAPFPSDAASCSPRKAWAVSWVG